MIAGRMNYLSLLLYYFLLVDLALALALAGNKPEVKETQVTGSSTTPTTTAPTTVTTEAPIKAGMKEEAHKNGEVELKAKESAEKPLPKKRGVLQDLYYKPPSNFDDNSFEDEQNPEEMYTAPRSDAEERSFFRSNRLGDTGFLNGDGYLENDGRRKRTAMFDGMYNGGREYAEPEIDLTPDEVIALLSLLEGRRIYNSPKQNRWSDYDNSVDSIEADMKDEDAYRDHDSGRFGDVYDGSYDNTGRYTSGMKRYMITRRRRSDFLGNPKLRVPIFRRAIL